VPIFICRGVPLTLWVLHRKFAHFSRYGSEARNAT